MATIKAFRAIRPREDMAEAVAALPYDVMDTEEARQMVVGKPHSFLHVDKAEIDLDKDVDHYSKEVYEKARQNLDKMLGDGVLVKEDSPCLYVYSLTMEGRTQKGLVVCTSVEEYLDGTIKKHELTRADKEQDRINHVDYCNANTGPIFLTYKADADVDKIIENWTKNNAPMYNFTSEDGIQHTAWKIDDERVINDLVNDFKAVKSLYIADGHHRNASAVKVALKRRGENPSYTGTEEYNFYLSVLFPDEQLKILDYNRVVKDLNGLDKNGFLDKLQLKFDVKEVGEMYKPTKTHDFGMYLEGKWYAVTAKKEVIPKDAVEALDVSILQKNVLEDILGIKDIRTDVRVNFVGGIRGLKELERLADSGEWKVAFAMYPTSVGELITIADEGKIMPPKSTWFEPKLRSGLFIHSLD